MSDIELTDEDLKIMYGTSAKAAFTAAIASCFLQLAKHRDGADLQRLLLAALQENLKRASSPNAPHPMSQAERAALQQYYRIFIGFYRDPNRPENLPPGATKH